MVRAQYQVHVFPFRRTDAGVYEYAVFRRSDNGIWQSIAGGGEGGELPIEAAKRESYEEAGLTFNIKYYPLSTISSESVRHFEARKHWPKYLYVVPGHYFGAAVSSGTISLSHEHTEYLWTTYDKAVEMLHWDSDRTALWELNERLMTKDLPKAV